MSRSSLVVIDMINPYDHADADKLVGSVREVPPQVAGLLERAGDSDVPVIYVTAALPDAAWTPPASTANGETRP